MKVILKFIKNNNKDFKIMYGRIKYINFLVLILLTSLCFTVPGATGAVLDPAVYGMWSAPFDSQIVGIHVSILPNGKVIYWDHDEEIDDGGIGGFRLWDPTTGAISTPPLPTQNVFCGGLSFMEDGRLFVTGGHISGYRGLPNAHVYDPFMNTWTELPEMNAGRWYPTNTTLANGDVLVISGATEIGTFNSLPQIWRAATDTWHNLTNADSPDGGKTLYPWMFLAPDGRVFKAGPERRSRFLNTSGLGIWTLEARSFFGPRDDGTAVLYDVGKGLIIGGNQQLPTATVEVFELTGASPTWRQVPSMAFARRFPNSTLLPDGTVLVTGGTSQPNARIDGREWDLNKMVYAAELWNPATETWSTLAAMQTPRSYHSTAALLPDGRVLVGGGEAPPPNNRIDYRVFEIFSPPYLFKGPRPVITDAPTSAAYGDTFFVETPQAMDISKVNWIRLSAVTHAFNQNQRINRLSFTLAPGGNGLYVTVPANGNLAPPGHYMLFILNHAGVPSVAHMIQLCVPGPTCLTPPVVVIDPPATTTVVSGTPMTFTGEATDATDGDLTDSLAWSSTRDGSLGTGETVTATLSVGTHIIAATVTDSSGLTDADTITVNVTAPSPTPSPPPSGSGTLMVKCVKYVLNTSKLQISGKGTPGSLITVYSGPTVDGPVLGTKTVKADGGFGLSPGPLANPGSITVAASTGDVLANLPVTTSCQ
jgi:hypothetical protein